MPDIDAATMHEDFSRWYGAVSMGDDQARRQARWEGVCAIVGGADRNTVESLLRLAHRSRLKPVADVVEAFREAFKTTDDTFEMSGNDRELQILAGACLAVLMEAEEAVGAAAALSATTAEFGGSRHPDLSMDLGALAEQAILRHGGANRERPSFEDQLPTPRVDFKAAASKVIEDQSWEGIAEAFKLAANRANGTMRSIAAAREDDFRRIAEFLRAQDEELNMLWWLTNQRSSDCECEFDEIPSAARPLVLATELAAYTEFLPGPPSVKGILSRAGVRDREDVRIANAVNAADSAWLQGLVDGVDPSFLSTPVHAAIKRQLETGPGDAWVAGWAASAELNDDCALSGLALGNLFYRERLLMLFE